jgi:hypothetical protein
LTIVVFVTLLLTGYVCSVPADAAPYPYGEPEFTATIIGDNECEPGNMTLLSIKVANIAKTSEFVLDPINPVASNPGVAYGAILTLDSGNSPATIIHTGITIPVLPPSTDVTLVFPVIIPADAQAGNYTLDLQIHSQYADSVSIQGDATDIFHYKTKDITLQVPITIKAHIRIKIEKISTSHISPGQDGIIRANITNIGDYTGNHASAELITDALSPITPYQGSYYLGTFAIGETRTIEWRAAVASQIDATTLPATVIITYEDKYGNLTESQPLFVGIPVHTGPKFLLSYDQPPITPGGSATVRVTYTNIGDAPASDAIAKIVPVNPITSPQTGGLLGTIAPGESAVIEYDFYVSQKALVKPYGVLTDVKYRGEDESIYLSDPLKIELVTVQPGILAILLSPLALVIILGILLLIGYLFLKRMGRVA